MLVGGITDVFKGTSDLASTIATVGATAGTTVVQYTSVLKNAAEVSIDAKVQDILTNVGVEWVYAQQPCLK